MAAQGQAFFEASLDFGSYANVTVPTPPGAPACTPLGAQMTFDMPYITIVGGTELVLAAGTWMGESAWAGSGGGVMPAVVFPSWQTNANPGNAKLSATFRNSPDVAMPASVVYIVYSSCDNVRLPPGIGGQINPALCTNNVNCQVQQVPDGMGGTKQVSIYTGCKAGGETTGLADVVFGTSAATPLWAGFMALANQQNQAKGRIGFPNPTLYAIGRGANYATSFNDINDNTTSNAGCDGTQYTAVAGYDQVTGWGSPRCGLITQLSPTVTTPPPQPFVSVAGNISQTTSSPATLCGNGLRFTPGATVTLTMTNVPGPNGLPRAPITLGTMFAVGADGKFSYTISGTPLPSASLACTPQQLGDLVTITATDAQQDIAHNTFNASTFCNNVTLPGSFGGGCP
jgi:hypothetical protein